MAGAAGQVEFDAGLGLDPAGFRARGPAVDPSRPLPPRVLRPGGPGGAGSGGEGAGGGGGGRGVTYGRTVVIECDGRPAAEVLEVVVP